MPRIDPLKRVQEIRGGFPREFWVLFTATFIDRLGGALLFPFFALYITKKFSVGMTEVGYLFALFSVASLFGGFVSGALTDRLGRRWMLMFGLVLSALSSLTMGFVERLEWFYTLAFFVGLFGNAGGPAQQAMVADLLPESKRQEGYGMIRVVANLAVTIGPAIGGLLAAQSYLYLFFLDAISSLITAGIVYTVLPETKPIASPDEPEESLGRTMQGYSRVFQDRPFLFFLFFSILMVLVYMQMNSTLSVYLRDVHGISERGFGLILSLNAGMVVAFQFWISRRIARRPPMILMAVGTALYAIGFALYGLVATYALFLIAMIIITVGEMVVVPTSQVVVANLSPEDMRGRYMAVYGLTWMLPNAVGPLLAGLIMDNYDPRWVWYLAGIVGVISAAGFALIQSRTAHQLEKPEALAEVRP